MNYNICNALVLPALVAAPRAYRALPCLCMVFSLMYTNTHRQHQLVLAATGKPILTISVVVRSIISLVLIAIIALPDTTKGKSD